MFWRLWGLLGTAKVLILTTVNYTFLRAPRGYDCHRPDSETRGGQGLATSLRLGDSEDLRLRSEATEDLTRRWDGEFFYVFFLCVLLVALFCVF